MSFDGRAIANFVLDACETEGRRVTHLSLQKIVYFCHAWSLVVFDRPLVKHKFEAWQYGPVLQYLYRDFARFDREPIVGRAMSIDPVSGEKREARCALDVDTKKFLTTVVDFYSRLSSSELAKLSHVEGGPWYQVWNHEGVVNPGMKIENHQIKEFYSKVRGPFSIQ